jgi:hypothetical protein
MFSFAAAVAAKYVVCSSGLPREDYPPANIAEMIRQCEALDRTDLAQQIRMQWTAVFNKYPKTRINWPTAVVIGGNSVKKNIFGGKEFVVWLASQQDMSAEHKAAAKAVPTILPPPKDAPAIAIPSSRETPSDWNAEALKTRQSLVEAKKAFQDVKEYAAFLEKEAQDLKKKIEAYGDQGPKSKTKDGAPSKMSERVPKWTAQLEATIAQIEETRSGVREVEGQFKKAASDYGHAPVTTVAYEKKAQQGLDNILAYVLDMKDLDKQKDLLEKLNGALEKQKATASAELVEAGDRLSGLAARFMESLKAIKAWLSALTRSVSSFGRLASLRY